MSFVPNVSVERVNKFVTRTAEIKDSSGNSIFKQEDCIFPESWSQLAVNVVASKYFYGDKNVPGEREKDVQDLINRVVGTITKWGRQQGYFDSTSASDYFFTQLYDACLNQYGAFNSPVWFNVGLFHHKKVIGSTGNYVYRDGQIFKPNNAYEYPQASACFIQSVQDNMDSIMALAVSEAMLFKFGSGTGTDLSTLRSTKEKLSGGGKPSGPLSFMRIYDQIAGVIKSGGKTRRAAKLQSLKVSHPDIMDFIECKAKEENKARALIKQGYDSNFNGEAYLSIFFQNANLSVRVTDEFMKAVEEDKDWTTKWVTDPSKDGPTYKAKDLLLKMGENAWACGDPGIQYDTTINAWHTCPNSGRINASNPCSEYMFLDDTACNLASINLMKFLKDDGSFDYENFAGVCKLFIIAQEILVGNASYPTPKIAENSVKYRPLGLGYSNLGALLMAKGIPYDSELGRAYCACITAIMHFAAYEVSALMAEKIGAFEGYAANKNEMLEIISEHGKCINDISDSNDEVVKLKDFAHSLFVGAYTTGGSHGFRNSQVTVLAPTGTISFMMDCDTTGIEPELALVKYKHLAGGGLLKIVNNSVALALKNLGYDGFTVQAILKWIELNDTIEGCPDIKEEDLPIFDCAFKADKGTRFIKWQAHVEMMAAAQPFLSGAISKCVTGNSIVSTSEGLKRIASLSDFRQEDKFNPLNNLQVAVGNNEFAESKDFYYGGIKPTYKVVLADGREITGTSVHRLQVATKNGLDWQEIPNLNPGDFVALSLGSNVWGNDYLPQFKLSPNYGGQYSLKQPTELSFKLGQFLGMLTSDGHVTRSNYVIGFTKNCIKARTLFKSLAKELFNLDFNDIKDERRCDKTKDGFTGVTLGSKGLMEWLDAFGWTKENIPDRILSGPKDCALGYLSGLYLDGYISLQSDVAISQKHRSIILDLQILWDNLNIATYISSNIVDGKDYPVLHAVSSYRKTMADLINWIEPHKIDRAASLENTEDKQLFPMYREKLADLAQFKCRTQEFRTLYDKRTITNTKRTIFDAADKLGVKIPEYERNLYYVPVVSVEYAGEQEVFDLAVPNYERFIANGIVNHNTVNMPKASTPEDIAGAYLLGWKRGLKAIAIYRDGSKESQPLSTTKEEKNEKKFDLDIKNEVDQKLKRERLPDTRDSITHKFSINGHEGYITVGKYPDGRPGELFVCMAKEGSTVSGLMDCFGTAISMCLQYGVPLDVLSTKFTNTKFDPQGFTKNKEIKSASSIIDYIFKWLSITFPSTIFVDEINSGEEFPDTNKFTKVLNLESKKYQVPFNDSNLAEMFLNVIDKPADSDCPPCDKCGSITIKMGACYLCYNCGSSMGCS